MPGRVLRIAGGLFEGEDVEAGGDQAMADFGIGLQRDREQDALAGENGDGAALDEIARGREFFGTFQNALEFRGLAEGFGRTLGAPGRAKLPQFPLARLFLPALPIVVLHPLMPALRADPADVLQILFNRVVRFFVPEFREALPVVDVQSREQVSHIKRFGRAALRQHGCQGFRTLQILGDTTQGVALRCLDGRWE